MVELAAPAAAVEPFDDLARFPDPADAEFRRDAAAGLRADDDPHAHGGAAARRRNRAASGGGDGMNGILNGGWNFVVAAYLVSGAILTIYSIHAVTEFRRRTKGISQ